MNNATFVPQQQVIAWQVQRRRLTGSRAIAEYDFQFINSLRRENRPWVVIAEAIGITPGAARMWYQRAVEGRPVEPVLRVPRGLVSLGGAR